MDIKTGDIKRLQAAVRDANRAIYDNIDLDLYEKNPSLFEAGRQARLKRTLRQLRLTTRGERLLDLGCGSGNVLKLARGFFPFTIGADLGFGILRQVKARNSSLRLVVADGLAPPFAPDSFDAVTMNGFLHHLADPVEVFREVVPLLRSGGALYTDHDVNCYFGRFYHATKKFRRRKHGGFYSETVALSEYHNVHTAGLDPFRLAAALKDCGCRRVRIFFRHTTNPRLGRPQRVIRVFLKMLGAATDAPSFYTHFALLAYK
jgi:ubiquinone/menaquinone biosynthesis C-methylase UbiE